MKLNGVVESIIYRNDDNGYTVFLVSASKTVFTFVGNLVKINVGEYIEAEVKEKIHELYGQQYEIIDYKIDIPSDDIESIYKFLLSLKVKGIGEATVRRLTGIYGNKTLDIIRDNPQELYNIKGLTYEKVDILRDKLTDRITELDLIIELGKYELSSKNIELIIDRYGSDALNVIRENPFKLAIDIDGIGFKTCDKIAEKNGLSSDSEKRIEAGIIYVLETEFANGNVFTIKSKLIEDVSDILSLGSGVNYEDPLYNLEANLRIKTDKIDDVEMIFLRQAYNIEKKLSELLYEKREDITIITGGPGTGKTYNIKKYLSEARDLGLKVALCAPTGRAAKRINEVTGYEAKTIHRLLECVGDKNSNNKTPYFNINEDNKLDIDLLIIDEMSMVDEYLMYALVRAVPEFTHMILVGDVDQLPSVGAGQVLSDMISSNLFNVIKLDKIYRQGEGSNIVENAHSVNHGDNIDLKDKKEDFLFVHKSADYNINDTVKKLVAENVPNHFKISNEQIQVICPSKIGNCGTENLNSVLQEALNPESFRKDEIKIGNNVFRVGDKVMQTTNNYNIPYDVVDENGMICDRGIGVYNGDIGEIVEIDDEEKIITVKYDDKITYYTKEEYSDLSLAYAITVHKSQGSEYDVVIMPITKFPYRLMTRRILYTAMTRAKKCMIFVGTENSFMYMLSNASEEKRNTALCSKLYLYDFK